MFAKPSTSRTGNRMCSKVKPFIESLTTPENLSGPGYSNVTE